MIHWLSHLFGWNGCRLTRAIIDRHEWLMMECVGCGTMERYKHSRVCEECAPDVPPQKEGDPHDVSPPD